ncbi:MAG: ATP-binding protein [Candidatus Omnitrophica bacterium]|nr:ATP-binding protein [Candidatus Omnitrophota bacterium]
MFVWLVIVLIFFIIYGVVISFYWESKLKEKTRRIKETEAQLIHMEKMASLGTLAAGIAHEINNPLSFLISNLETLKDYTHQLNQSMTSNDFHIQAILDDLTSIAQESLEGALRIKRIVQDLRTFSRRKEETQRVPTDVNQVLESTLAIVWNEIKYKITVIKDYQAKTSILADPTQLSQVFLNILINASQAIENKGTITISTYEDTKNVYIKISDTGCGIAPEILPKIFDPFFSTKKGTGLGLSVSYNIIKHHGGEIKVESKVNKGTSFIIQLPKV